MSRWLKLIWFAEDRWTKYHAAVGINAEKTLCGIMRSTRAILPSEKGERQRTKLCLKCLAALKKRFGYEDVRTVKVE